MKNSKIGHVKYFLFTTILSIVITFAMSDSAFSFGFIGWGIGATGYELGFYEAKKREEPMFLFFRLDSNEFCERLENEYFNVDKVYDFFMDYSKVVIDLEGDIFDKDLADKYDVEEGPAFFIIFPFLEIEPQGVSPFLKDRDMTVDEFIQNIQKIFILTYNNKGQE